MAELDDIKLQIWTSKQIRKNIVDLQVYADKAGVHREIIRTFITPV